MQLMLILVTITVLSEAKKRRHEKKKKINPMEALVPLPEGEYPEKYIPVPFGHITKEGFQPRLKQPLDLLEFDTRYDKDFLELKETMNRKTNQAVNPKSFVRPKESIYYSGKELPDEEKEVEEDVKRRQKDSDRERKTWLDLAAIHARNLAMTQHGRPSNFRVPHVREDNLTIPEIPEHQAKRQFFSRTSYGLHSISEEHKHQNWTTCDEFGRNADFHPKDVININWVPFYTWSSGEIRETAAFIHRFTYPTVKLVQQYKTDIGPYLNKTLDWEGPKLYLKSNMELLLVAVDRRGEFEGLPYNKVPSSMKDKKVILPTINLRLKIVDPYLAMMFCDFRFATIMAVSGNEPATVQEMMSEAATLKFKGIGHPVARDLEEERMIAQRERQNMIEMEKDRFLEAEDQVDGFPFEL